MGIFGIFGPTGAGKSTILDAITLALYGNIARGQNTIRGIMNHFENELGVSFEFALGDAYYLAERSYRRRGEGEESTIYNSLARLVVTKEGQVDILADGAMKVSSEIEKLLGMDFKDFTRAVIIPQNEFDKFLTLTDSERVKMLEKIFNLEEYGEKLNRRVKKLYENLDGDLQLNNRLLLELGDASEDIIKKTQKDLEDKEQEVRRIKKQELKLEKQLKEMEEIASKLKEIKALEDRKKAMEDKKTYIKEIQAKLKTSRQLSSLKEPIRQIDGFRNLIIKEEKKLKEEKIYQEELEKALEEIFNKFKKIDAMEGKLNKLREEELPKISLSKEYERNIGQLKNNKKESKDHILKIKDELEKNEEKLKKISQAYIKEEEILKDLKVKRTRANNFQGCRGEIDGAIVKFRALEEGQKLEEASKKQLKARQDELEELEKTIRRLFAKNIKVCPDMSLEELLYKAQDKLDKDIKDQEDLKKALEEEKDKNMAVVLAAKLKEGQACQVCGSRHHPELARDRDVLGLRALEEREKGLFKSEKDLGELRKWLQEVHIKINTYENIKKEITSNYGPNLERQKKKLLKEEEGLQEAMDLLKEKAGQLLTDYKLENTDHLIDLKKELDSADEEYQQINAKTEKINEELSKLDEDRRSLANKQEILANKLENYQGTIEKYREQINKLTEKKKESIGHMGALEFERKIKGAIQSLDQEIKFIKKAYEQAKESKNEHDKIINSLEVKIATNRSNLQDIEGRIEGDMIKAGFESLEELKKSLLTEERERQIEDKINDYQKEYHHLLESLTLLKEKISKASYDVEKHSKTRNIHEELKEKYDQLIREEGALKSTLANLIERQKRWKKLQKDNKEIVAKRDLVSQLLELLGKRNFVRFLAEEHLRDIAVEASKRLADLTNQRYGLELGEGFSFMMRDEYNNKAKRWVNTLSGGETFLTSLALALALSSKIQLKGQPLGLFFLDEGFGSLDNEKLDLVMATLEKIRKDNRMVGIISHVEELKNRMPKYIEVVAPRQGGEGSKIKFKSI